VQPSAGAVDRLQADAVFGNHLGQPVAFLVDETGSGLEVERTNDRRRTEQAAAEPGTFLIGPIDHCDGDRRGAFGGQGTDKFHTGHDTEGAVQPAALRHAVEVRADHDRVVAGAAQVRP